MTTNPATNPAPAGVAARLTQGDIAARIDRLPLSRIQYGVAAITQIYWGLIIATDGMPARLYPFLGAPKGMTNFQFSVLLAANVGAGILAGEYLGGFLSDRYGRKKVLIAAAVVDAVFLWPLGFTDSFWWLLAWNFLFAIGMGFLLSTNAVYLHEVAPPGSRHRIAMRTQMLTALAALGPAILAYFWIPSHYRWFLFALAERQRVAACPGVAITSMRSPDISNGPSPRTRSPPWIGREDRRAGPPGQLRRAAEVIGVPVREQDRVHRPALLLGQRDQRGQVPGVIRPRIDDDHAPVAGLVQQPGVGPVEGHRARVGREQPGRPGRDLAGHTVLASGDRIPPDPRCSPRGRTPQTPLRGLRPRC